MKITTDYFDAIDEEKEKEFLLKELHSEQTYRQISYLYADFVRKYAKRTVWFLSPTMTADTKSKKVELLKRFVNITVELGVPFDVYMKSQFESLVPWLKKNNPRMPYPSFPTLVSDKAVGRFHRYAKHVKESYTGKKGTVEFYRTSFLDLEKSLSNSAQKLHDRLVIVKEANGGVLRLIHAVKELELLTRAGQLSNIYVWSSPLVQYCESGFVLNVVDITEGLLTKEQKQSVQLLRKRLSAKFEDKGIMQYV